MIKLDKNGTVTLNVKTQLRSYKQRRTLEQLLKKDAGFALEYFNSFLGIQSKQASLFREVKAECQSNNQDELGIKDKLTIAKLNDGVYRSNITHKPLDTNLGQWIGIEIECFVNKDDFCRHAGQEGMGVNTDYEECDCSAREDDEDAECYDECASNNSTDEGYHRALRKYFDKMKLKRVNVKSDGSIDADDSREEFTVEVTILFNVNDKKPLFDLCTVLNKLSAKVNASCGMHVHFDQRDLIEGDIYLPQLHRRGRALEHCLPLLALMVPQSRRKNSYCKLSKSILTRDSDRYHAINMTAFKKYKTIEVRLHSATTNYNKIANWIDLLTLIMVQGPKSEVHSIDDLVREYNIPEKLIAYVQTRVEKFRVDSTVAEDSEAA